MEFKSLAKVLKDLLANKIEFSEIVLTANKKIDLEHNLSKRTGALFGLYSEVLNEKLEEYLANHIRLTKESNH